MLRTKKERGRERQRERQRETEKDRQREKQREKQRERQRERERERKRKRESKRNRQRTRRKERESKRERERKRTLTCSFIPSSENHTVGPFLDFIKPLVIGDISTPHDGWKVVWKLRTWSTLHFFDFLFLIALPFVFFQLVLIFCLLVAWHKLVPVVVTAVTKLTVVYVVA